MEMHNLVCRVCDSNDDAALRPATLALPGIPNQSTCKPHGAAHGPERWRIALLAIAKDVAFTAPGGRLGTALAEDSAVTGSNEARYDPEAFAVVLDIAGSQGNEAAGERETKEEQEDDTGKGEPAKELSVPVARRAIVLVMATIDT
ncbi:hypothetical protein HYQ46_012522 [Verticillium longisporum]|nr:hypothetical protein HYQ46_012522 [Verticillium longisporum]